MLVQQRVMLAGLGHALAVLQDRREALRVAGEHSRSSLSDRIDSVRVQGLEGLVAKWDSLYEAGQRSGAWQKMRINQGQEFVIAGYTPSAKNFDALIFGYYEGDKLMYAARTRTGFTPAMREQLFKRFRGLEIAACPFANLPEKKSGRWARD